MNEQEPKQDQDLFNLRYVRKSDMKECRVQRLIHGDYKIIDPETGAITQLTRKRFRNAFIRVKSKPQSKAA